MGSSKKVTVSYWYKLIAHLGWCKGPIDALLELRGGDRVAWAGRQSESGVININKPDLYGGESAEGGIQGQFEVMMGEPDQMPNSYLASEFGAAQPGYRGRATVVLRGPKIGAGNPYPKPLFFKLERIFKGWDNGVVWYPEKAGILLGDTSTDQLVTFDSQWKYKEEGPSSTADYSAVYYDDSDWPIGPGGFGNYAPGFNTPPANTLIFGGVVPTTAHNKVWIRRKIGPVPNGAQLRIDVWKDDLARLWFNGEEVTLIQDPSDWFHQFAVVNAANMLGENTVAIMVEDSAGGGNPTYIYAAMALSAVRNGFYSMNPAHILYDSITSRRENGGMEEPIGRINDASFRAAADKLYAEGFGLCTSWKGGESAEAFQQRILNVIGGSLTQSRKDGLYYLDLLRGDYVREDLPTLTDDDIIDWMAEPALPSETVNQIQVQWFDPETREDRITTPVQALGAIENAGGVLPDIRDYPEIPSEALAMRVAQRDLKAAATPLWRFDITTNRKPYDLRPGTYLRLLCPKRGFADTVVVIGDIDYGNFGGDEIKIVALQDVFGMPNSAYVDSQGSLAPPTDVQPTAIDIQTMMESPYVELAASLSDSQLSAVVPDAAYVLAGAVRPANGLNYVFASKADGEEYERYGTGDWMPAARVDGDYLGRIETVVTFNWSRSLPQVTLGTWALWDDEIVRIDAVDEVTNTVTLARGCADTLPQPHYDNSIILFIGDWNSTDQREYSAGEAVSVKLLNRTSQGEFPIDQVAPMTEIMNQRQYRPYPPADVKLNDEYWPADLTGDVAVTWADRDRLLQADQLLSYYDGSVGPEPGTTYNIRVYDVSDDSEIYAQDGVTSPHVVPGSALVFNNRLELYSVRDSIESWQKFSAEFTSGFEIEGGPDRNGYVIGEAVSIGFTTTVTGVTWSIDAGVLPSGWSIDAGTGVVSGRADDAVGAYSFTVKAESGGGGTAYKNVTVKLGRMSLLMHMDGADASTTFTDETGKPVTRNGATAEIDTAFSMFGGASGLFNGDSGFVSVPQDSDFMFGTGPFTISGWFRLANIPGSLFYAPYGNWYSGAPQDAFCMFFRPSRQMTFQVSTGTSSNTTAVNSYPAAATWFHMEASRDDAGVFRIFIDGVKVLEQASFTPNFLANLPFRVAHNGVSYDQYPGHIDELAVIKGVAEHISNFTPPTAARDFVKPSSYPRRWRVRVTGVQSGNIASICELELRASAGGANLATGGYAYASSHYSNTYIPSAAFDGSASTNWASASAGVPAWLAYELPSDHTINEVAIKAGTASLEQYPAAFTVQSSSDGGVTWTDEWSVSGIAAWTSGLQRVFTRP